MPQATIPGSMACSDETPENMEARNQREIAQARLDWQTRQGNSLTQRIRWRRFYRKYKYSREALERIERDLTMRVSMLEKMAEKPSRYTSGSAWTQTMERLEDVTAELGVVRGCLKAGGS